MTVNEAIQAYIKKFGGYPKYMLMGADDDYVIELVTKALETGKEIEFDYSEEDDY